MKNPRRLIFAGTFVIGLSVLIWIGVASREPIYQGKSLSHWLEQYGTNHWHAPDRELDKQAETAIRHIGTNAEPMLLKMMATTASRTRLKLLAKIPRPWLARLHFSDVNAYRHEVAEHRRLGAYGFVALGPDAKPAVPALITLLNDRDPDVRYVAAFTLRCLGPVARDALPSLIICLNDPEFTVRDDSVMALGTIHEQAPRVVPVLIQFIEKNRADRILCDDAIASLGSFGPQAKPAVPILLELLNSEHVSVRSAATNALRQIDADAATSFHSP